MVFSWFKKRGRQDPSRKSSGQGQAAAKDKDKAKNKVEAKSDTAASPEQVVTEVQASNPLALAAAQVLGAADADQAQQALAQLTDPQVITYVALQQPTLREAALGLPQMRSEAALQVMEKQSRERNKGINRFARNGLERLKTQRRDASELGVRGAELNTALSKHNNDIPAQKLTYAQRHAVVTQLQQEYSNCARQYQQMLTELAECAITLEPFPAMVVVELQPPEPEPLPEAEQTIDPEPEPVASAADTKHLAESEQLLQALAAIRQPLAKANTTDTASPAAFADLMTQLPELQQRWQALNTRLRDASLSDSSFSLSSSTDSSTDSSVQASSADLASADITSADLSFTENPELVKAASSVRAQLSELEQLATACVALDALVQLDSNVALPSRPDIDLTKPSDEALGAFSAYQDAIAAASKTTNLALRKLRWPDWAQANAAVTAPIAHRDAIKAEQRWVDEQNQALNGQLRTALDTLTETLDSGQAAQSKTQMGRVRRLKQALGKLDPKHSARLNTLNSRLTELVDWQTFATTPKRQELLDAITQIAEAPLAPEVQTNRVKQLRAQWNELGGVSKATDRRLAERFNAQAQTAFDHCREHFAELAQLRAANSLQREQICQQLSDYLTATDLNNNDVKAAEQILRTARDAWRQCFPVERKTAKPLEKKFEALQQQLHDNIKAVWANNETAKLALLSSAQALVANTDSDLNERINQAKNLQKEWQEIGPMPRGGERKLWLAFRESCDALFSERDGAKQQQQVAEQAAIATLTARIDSFADLLSNTTAADASIAQLRAARTEFSSAQGSLPGGGVHNQLKRRFEALCNDYEVLLQAQQRQALHQRLDDLAAWDTTTTATGDDAPLPANADAKLLQGLAAIPAAAPTFESLQRLVLTAEILAEVPSPTADEALRLQVQVERLQQTMGQKSAVDQVSGDLRWIDLALQWCSQRPKPKAAEVTELRQRYFTALRSALSPR